MTVYNWSSLTNNQQIAFNPSTDKLTFDSSAISAASLTLSWVSNTSTSFAYSGKSVTLLTDVKALTTTNVSFANGSLLVVGDNATAPTADDSSNGLNGSAQADLLTGLGGDDWLSGGAGNDILNGGDGSDTVDYGNGNGSAGVIVNLQTGVATDNWGATDTLVSIEELNGSTLNDTMLGDGNNNSLEGRSGNDVLNGAAGNDWVSGDDGNDTLSGGAGDDNHDGGVGNDILNGGPGNDRLRGGDGNDVAVYSGNKIEYALKSAGADLYFITDLRTGAPDGLDILAGIETLRFADGDTTLNWATPASPQGVNITIKTVINGYNAFGSPNLDDLTGSFGDDTVVIFRAPTSSIPGAYNFEVYNRFVQTPNYSYGATGFYGQPYVSSGAIASGYIEVGGPAIPGPINQPLTDGDLVAWILSSSKVPISVI